MEGYWINFSVQSRLTTIFLYKSIASAQTHSYAMSFLFCGDKLNRKSTNQTQEHSMESNNIFKEIVLLFRVTS